MIDPALLVRHLEDCGVEMFTGVPDSLLKPLCSHIMAALPDNQHVVAANEGAAVGIAIGHYLRTGQPALVYMQNSGVGNAINPLISLADPEVYGCPMVLLIGWRGQPGVVDEPQHVKQGRIMGALLDALELPWSVLPKDEEAALAAVTHAVESAGSGSRPFVLLVEKGTFTDTAASGAQTALSAVTREDALSSLVAAVGSDPIFVSTTGKLSRELFEYRERTGRPGTRDFLTIGGMGHCSSIALGIAMREPDVEVWCLDGDGALLMHLGSVAVIAEHAPRNYFHVVFNNGVHDSVGGQPTAMRGADIVAAAGALGYRYGASVAEPLDLSAEVARMRQRGGPSMLELKVRPGSRGDLGRPSVPPTVLKEGFMRSVR